MLSRLSSTIERYIIKNSQMIFFNFFLSPSFFFSSFLLFFFLLSFFSFLFFSFCFVYFNLFNDMAWLYTYFISKWV